jgi:hypothetical protein
MSDELISQAREMQKRMIATTLPGELADALEAQARRIEKLENEIACRDALIDDHLRKIMHLENLIEAEAFKVEEAEASIDRNDEWTKGFIEKTDARIAELEAVLKEVEDWWLSDGMKLLDGAPYAMFRVRAALNGEKE